MLHNVREIGMVEYMKNNEVSTEKDTGNSDLY
jgi:hypothetical protein